MNRKLAVFDVDGTLVDSRQAIYDTMVEACARLGAAAPPYELARQVVGLNLAEALVQLAPDLDQAGREQLVVNYRAVFQEMHAQPGYVEPLYPGAAELLSRLRGEGWMVAMATGKSRRGVETIMRMHGWVDLFDSTHCADDGPGKPDPAMLVEAMRVLAAERAHTIMIGDTAHDIHMALAAGVHAQGVSWGFHTAEEIAAAGAHDVSHSFDELNAALDRFATAVAGAS
jgi:phosphoglycolate phosphatase